MDRNNINPFSPGEFQAYNAPLQQQEQEPGNTSQQARFEQQLSELQHSAFYESSAEAGSPDGQTADGGEAIRRTDVGGSMQVPPIQGHSFSSTRQSVDIPHTPFGRSTEVPSKRSRENDGPDEELFSRFREASKKSRASDGTIREEAKKSGPSDRTIRRDLEVLRNFSAWLQAKQKPPISSQLENLQALRAEGNEFAANDVRLGARIEAALTRLEQFAVGAPVTTLTRGGRPVEAPVTAFGASVMTLPRGGRRVEALVPEDEALINAACDEGVKRGFAAVTMQEYRRALNSFGRWLNERGVSITQARPEERDRYINSGKGSYLREFPRAWNLLQNYRQRANAPQPFPPLEVSPSADDEALFLGFSEVAPKIGVNLWALRQFSAWLQATQKPSISTRIENLEALRAEADEFAGDDVRLRNLLRTALPRLRQHQQAVEANRALGLGPPEQAGSVAGQDALQPSSFQELPATPATPSEGSWDWLREQMQEPAPSSSAPHPGPQPSSFQELPATPATPSAGAWDWFREAMQEPTPSSTPHSGLQPSSYQELPATPATPSAGGWDWFREAMQELTPSSTPHRDLQPSSFQELPATPATPSAGAWDWFREAMQEPTPSSTPHRDLQPSSFQELPATPATSSTGAWDGFREQMQEPILGSSTRYRGSQPSYWDWLREQVQQPEPSSSAKAAPSIIHEGLEPVPHPNAPTVSELRDDVRSAPARGSTRPPSFIGPSAPPQELPEIGHLVDNWRHRSQPASDALIDILGNIGLLPNQFGPSQFAINGERYSATFGPGGRRDVQLIHHPRPSQMSEVRRSRQPLHESGSSSSASAPSDVYGSAQSLVDFNPITQSELRNHALPMQASSPGSGTYRGRADLPDIGPFVGDTWNHNRWDNQGEGREVSHRGMMYILNTWNLLPTPQNRRIQFTINGELYTAELRSRQSNAILGSGHVVYLIYHPQRD
ncbi:hypothetical protein [Bradyrhizobium icense]|uniref:Uncharacterized protein n=1 Tax=Bradyrhizobium icense TaxID=1274631 RepID=A0A1B1UJ27_9BRAD|nr:hypothetical protein [Bradyrhizobium icense]ANW02799.1 hypothetical protein LMTR13_24185 [Bradyrhizobium icense]